MPRVFTVTYTQSHKPDPKQFGLSYDDIDLRGEDILYDWQLMNDGRYRVFLTSTKPLNGLTE